MIPFGHGGSYTTFEWGEPVVTGSGTDLTVEVPITNTGHRAGSEVVQVYVAPAQPPVARPVKELAGFAKLVHGRVSFGAVLGWFHDDACGGGSVCG